MEAGFFKNFLDFNALIAFGVMVLVGLFGGQLVHAARYFSRIVGYILIGCILGPHGIGVLTPDVLGQSHIFQKIAIGLILFELGLQVNVKMLVAQPVLIKCALIQSAAVFLLVFVGLILLHVNMMVAALAATLGVSISPAVTLLIANEYNAKGIVVKQALILTALNNILAYLLYAVIIAVTHQSNEIVQFHKAVIEWLYPFYRTFGSIVLAFILAILMIGIGRFVGKKENLQFTLLVSILIIALGVAISLYFSPLLTMLMLGIFVINLDHKKALVDIELGYMGEIFIVILFVAVGAELQVDYFIKAGWLVLAFIGLRFLGAMLPLLLLKNKMAMNVRQSLSVGITLFPLAGVAISLLGTTEKLDTGLHNSLSAIILPAIALLELVGPITTTFALRWAGEMGDQTHEKMLNES